MKQEFVTSNGKVIVEDDTIKVRNMKPTNSYEHYRYLIWVFIGVTIIIGESKIKPLGYLIVLFAGVILIADLVNYIYLNGWKNKFNIANIKSYKVVDDPSGLETSVTLYFKSNTAKVIPFRKSEKQYDAFVQLIDQYLTQFHLA